MNAFSLIKSNNATDRLREGMPFIDHAGLGAYDNRARWLDAVVGSFWQPDPMAGSYPSFSPYANRGCNPTRFLDPSGEKWVMNGGCSNGMLMWEWDEDVCSLNEAKEKGYKGFLPCGSIVDNARINGGEWGSVYLGYSASDVFYTTSNKTVTPWQVGWEWLSGTGPRRREFHDGDNFAEQIRSHSSFQETLNTAKYNYWLMAQSKGSRTHSLSEIEGTGQFIKDIATVLTAGKYGNLTATFLGSYNTSWVVNPESGIITFTLENYTTMESASRPPYIGYSAWWQKSVGAAINNYFNKGWGSRTSQIITLTESIY